MAFEQLGADLIRKETQSKFRMELEKAIEEAYYKNQWFTAENVRFTLKSIGEMLQKENLEKWLRAYPQLEKKTKKRNVAIIMAGNIPLVGFHDLICVLIAGNNALVKTSSSGNVLLPLISDRLKEINSEFNVKYVEKIENADALIATGSNNTARYFEYYFSKIPHIIRKNRNSIAILTGEESEEDLKNLGNDIFRYFGLGCRNVSKIFVPEGYDFNMFWKAIQNFDEPIKHTKYANNYDYYKACFLLNKIPFFTNDVLMLKEDKSMSGPVSVLHYEYYLSKGKLEQKLADEKENIQCVVSSMKSNIAFGETQNVNLWDYADNVDVIEFLMSF